MPVTKATTTPVVLMVGLLCGILGGCGTQEAKPIPTPESPKVETLPEVEQQPRLTEEPPQGAESGPSLKAEDLIKAFQSDSEAAEAKYKDKKMTIEGVVFGKDSRDNSFKLSTPVNALAFDTSTTVSCSFHDKTKGADLRNGQSVKVDGICGYLLAGISIPFDVESVTEVKQASADFQRAVEEEGKAIETLEGLKFDLRPSPGWDEYWNVKLKKEDLTEDGSIKSEIAGPLQKIRRIHMLLSTSLPLSNGALEQIRNLSSVTDLAIDDTHVTDSGLAHIKSLTWLTWLKLNKEPEMPAITDDGLAHLKDMVRMRSLDLRNAQITDKGMENLKGMTNESVR